MMPDRSFWNVNQVISEESIKELVKICVEHLDVATASSSFLDNKVSILGQITVGDN